MTGHNPLSSRFTIKVVSSRIMEECKGTDTSNLLIVAEAETQMKIKISSL